MKNKQFKLLSGERLPREERRYIKRILTAAKDAGYENVSIPYAGDFSLVQIAIESGFDPGQVIVSGLFGIDAHCAEIICSQADLITDANIRVIYDSWCQRLASEVSSIEYRAMLIDAENRRLEYLNSIRDQVEALHAVCCGVKVAEYYASRTYKKPGSNQNVVIVNEKDSPEGDEWMPEMAMNDSKELVLIIQESTPSDCVGEPVFCRYGIKKAKPECEPTNRYISTNNEKLIGEWSGGFYVIWKDGLDMIAGGYNVIPMDYVISDKSKIVLRRLPAANGRYYRYIWTNTGGSVSSKEYYAIIIDGYLAGTIGYRVKMLDEKHHIIITHAASPKHNLHDLSILAYIISKSKKVLQFVVPPSVLDDTTMVFCAQKSKHPEPCYLDGIFEIIDREPNKTGGFLFTLKATATNNKLETILAKFLEG